MLRNGCIRQVKYGILPQYLYFNQLAVTYNLLCIIKYMTSTQTTRARAENLE